MNTTATIEILKAQCPNFEYYYAIVDCAQDEGLFEKIQLSGCQYSTLFWPEASEELLRVSPHIIELQDNDFCAWLQSQGWGKSWAVYIASERPIGYLIRHFRKLGKVIGPNHQSWFFRYYDPRVCRDLLPICDIPQLDKIIGETGVFWMEGESAFTTKKFYREADELHCCTYSVNNDGQACKKTVYYPGNQLPSGTDRSFLKFRQDQCDTLGEVVHRNFILKMIRVFSERYPQKLKVYDHEKLIEYIEFALTQMTEIGGYGRRSAFCFINTCFVFGWDFLSNPDYQWIKENFLTNGSIGTVNKRLEALFNFCCSRSLGE